MCHCFERPPTVQAKAQAKAARLRLRVDDLAVSAREFLGNS